MRMRDLITLVENGPTVARNPMDDPNFRKWFGNSVIRDQDGRPLRVYHGTYNDIKAFNNESGMIFFATDPKFASGYASTRSGSGGVVMACYLRIEKLYDFRTKKGQDIASSFWSSNIGYGASGLDAYSNRCIRVGLYGREDVEDDDNSDIHDEQLTYDEWMRAIREGQYPALECYDFLSWIRDRLKHDGMVVVEGGSVNYAVFSRNQIKSAVSNTGAFNRRSPKISESR